MPKSDVARSTPPDIVREIFKPFATRLEVLKSGSTRRFPWHLGHIRSSWRAVFLSMHREFWSEIQFDAQPPQESAGRYTRIAKFYLKRGQDFPISFEFLEGIPFLPVLRALMAQSERWLDASFNSLHSHRLLSVRYRLPLLRSLTISHIGHLEEPDVFKDAPNLTRLTLTAISLWEFNWPSLTIFVFELASTRLCDRFLNVLSQMESLEKLLVKHAESVDEIDLDLDVPAIILPRLKVLATVGFMINLLLVIETPILEELYIDIIHALAWREPYHICPYFFENSPCDRLNRLTILTYDEIFVKHVLRYTPHVQFLSVMLPDDERDMLYNYLTCSQGQAPLLPVMQQLCTYCTGTVELLGFDELRVMVESRTNSIDRCFKELMFVFDDPDVLAPFSRAVQPICELNHVRFKAEVFGKDADLALSFLHGG